MTGVISGVVTKKQQTMSKHQFWLHSYQQPNTLINESKVLFLTHKQQILMNSAKKQSQKLLT